VDPRLIGDQSLIERRPDMPTAEYGQRRDDKGGERRPPDFFVVDRPENKGKGGHHRCPEQETREHVRHPVRAEIDPRETDGDDQGC